MEDGIFHFVSLSYQNCFQKYMLREEFTLFEYFESF